jgi:hypothetical protein
MHYGHCDKHPDARYAAPLRDFFMQHVVLIEIAIKLPGLDQDLHSLDHVVRFRTRGFAVSGRRGERFQSQGPDV